jgi:5-methyltetrahydropteroyltriglutamate--homocysteine methyltransferase
MNLILANHSSFPRIGDAPEFHTLRQTIARWERGERTFADVQRAQDDAVRRAIADQVAAGLDLVTDGLIRWYDPLSHIAGKLEGTKINGLLRFFDTNFYVRQPVVVGRLGRSKPIIVEEYTFARSVSPRPVKVVLTGPYTLAVFSIVQTQDYGRRDRLVEAYAQALAEEVRAIVAAGALLVQIEEPAALKEGVEWDLFEEAIRRVASAASPADVLLCTYFGDASPFYGRLQELPVAALGFDFTYSPRLPDVIMTQGSPKPLALGLLDGRNTKLEDEAAVSQLLEKLLSAIRADHSYLMPSCGLEYLPRDRAVLKLKRLVDIGRRFRNGTR